MKNFFARFCFSVAMLAAAQAGAWCYMLPESITYGSGTDAMSSTPLTGLIESTDGTIAASPQISHLSNGNIITANIHSVDSFEIYFYYYDPELPAPENAPAPVKIVIGQEAKYDAQGNSYLVRRNQGIGLSKNLKSYYIVNIDPIPQPTEANPYVRNVATDVWTPGNWVGEFPTMMASANEQGLWGGWLRVTAAHAIPLPGVPTAVRIRNIVRFGENFATTQSVPSSAAEAPFATSSLRGVLTVAECQITDTCPVPPVVDNKKPVTVKWSINRNN